MTQDTTRLLDPYIAPTFFCKINCRVQNCPTVTHCAMQIVVNTFNRHFSCSHIDIVIIKIVIVKVINIFNVVHFQSPFCIYNVSFNSQMSNAGAFCRSVKLFADGGSPCVFIHFFRSFQRQTKVRGTLSRFRPPGANGRRTIS